MGTSATASARRQGIELLIGKGFAMHTQDSFKSEPQRHVHACYLIRRRVGLRNSMLLNYNECLLHEGWAPIMLNPWSVLTLRTSGSCCRPYRV